MSSWGVALVGCGTVGGGTAAILTQEAAHLAAKTGARLDLRAIVDRDFSHARHLGLDEALFRESLDEVLADPEVHVVVELAGGLGFAKTVIEKALDAGKHVVTANKALLAAEGPALFARARSRGLTIGFEASCVGGVPIIRTLAEALVANRITALTGVVNGTCNAILTDMGTHGLDYPTALQKAQAQGFAEADPTLDVSGADSVHKLVLLAATGCGVWLDSKAIRCRGLEGLTSADLEAAGRFGARVKLLARVEAGAQGWKASVEPTVVPLSHPLAGLEGPVNGVEVVGNQTGPLYFQGRGAGARPTASAVVSDLAALAAGTLSSTQKAYTCWPDRATPVDLVPDDHGRGPWFVYGPGRAPEVTQGHRADLEAQGLRVWPWFTPRT